MSLYFLEWYWLTHIYSCVVFFCFFFKWIWQIYHILVYSLEWYWQIFHIPQQLCISLNDTDRYTTYPNSCVFPWMILTDIQHTLYICLNDIDRYTTNPNSWLIPWMIFTDIPHTPTAVYFLEWYWLIYHIPPTAVCSFCVSVFLHCLSFNHVIRVIYL